MSITVGVPGVVGPPADALLRTAKRNEERGFDVIWWPDHLMGWHPESIWTPDLTPLAHAQPNPHMYFDPVAAIAGVAAVTERIGLGTSVTEPVRNHPAQLARAWITLDHLSGGRAILGIGAGEGENITPYGMSFERPASRLEDALRVVRLLWEHNDPVDYEGPFYRLERAVFGMDPYEPGRYPPIWVAAHGPRMARITGELGDGWLPTYLDPPEYELRWSQIRAAAEKVGRDPDAITAGMWAYTVVAEDHEACHRILEDRMVKGFHLILSDRFFSERGSSHPLGTGYYGLADYIPTHYSREDALQAIDRIPFEVVHDATLHGTPDEIARKVERYAQIGLRHMAMWNISFFGDLERVGPSFRLLDEAKNEIKRIRVE